MINVKHVSFSKEGGAGRVAQYLFEFQQSLDYFQTSFEIATEGALRDLKLKNLGLIIPAMIDEFIVNKDRLVLFSLFRNRDNNRIRDVLKNKNHIFHLHWIEGIIGNQLLKNILKSESLKVWTIHDMAPLTGGCHYSLGCIKYQSGCDRCPMAHQIFWHKISQKKESRNAALKHARNTVLVFPTQKFKSRFSFLDKFQNVETKVIPNPVDKLFFDSNKNIEKDKIRFGFVSSQLNNPIKGYQKIVRILQKISEDLDSPIELIAVGDNRIGKRKYQINSKFSVVETGKLIHDKDLVKFYSAIDLNLSISREESFGLTIAEASAVGVPSLIMSSSSSSELISSDLNGWIAKDENDFMNLIRYLVKSNRLKNNNSTEIKEYAKKKWSIETIHNQYEAIYRNYS